MWLIRINEEVRGLYKTPHLVANAESRSFECLGHVFRMDQTKAVKKNIYSKLEGRYLLVRFPQVLSPKPIAFYRRLKENCDIWGSHAGEYEDYCLLGCDTVQSGRSLPMFRRNLLLPSPQ
jgi:hypothetical protein